MSPRPIWIVAAATLVATAHADEAAVRATLQKSFQQSPIQAISKSPVPGLIEAVVGSQVLYLTEDGRYLLGGPLFDVKADRNLTEARLEQVNAIPFDSLKLDWAIKRVKGNGARRIAIFEDPDCPYCRVLEQTLTSIDNLTVYVFLFPIDQLHPEAAAKSRAVWCAPDRAKAWDEVMRTGAVPAGAPNARLRWPTSLISPSDTGSTARPRRFWRTGAAWSVRFREHNLKGSRKAMSRNDSGR